MLAKSHYSNDPDVRKPGKCKLPDGKPIKYDEEKYTEADQLVEAVMVDLVNGWSYGDVKAKLMQGLYEGQKRPYKKSMACNYIAAARGRLREDSSERIEDMRALVYARYESLFKDCIDAYDHLGARSVLDSMCKLMGLNKKEAPDTAIQINNSTSGVTINFGFSKEDGD